MTLAPNPQPPREGQEGTGEQPIELQSRETDAASSVNGHDVTPVEGAKRDQQAAAPVAELSTTTPSGTSTTNGEEVGEEVLPPTEDSTGSSRKITRQSSRRRVARAQEL